jgi:hypothetical protein
MLVAQMSVATGIAPNDLLDAPPQVFKAMLKVLNDRAKKQNPWPLTSTYRFTGCSLRRS